ncbi:hypothetical protein H4219_002224 [Mycoemilia scoparia]|uniref:Chromatin target of PRMT1 protein C-terminal domain-containing protein n=1 Tax=Mycoemilia scoparia TaxID=417184 RepID=A0A9W8DPE3_9FUNG|nr:hypothetical protein H4219_002224 [Mycoemilia scoparia]
MNYDQSGRSKGTANVIFQNAADAARFVQDFNDRLLDNRPMKVRFVYAPGAPQPGLHYYQQPQLISVPVPAAGQTSSRGSNNGVSKSTRRQGGGRTQGRRGGRQNKGRPTKEQLDRDLDSMMQVDEEPAKPASTAAINPAA